MEIMVVLIWYGYYETIWKMYIKPRIVLDTELDELLNSCLYAEIFIPPSLYVCIKYIHTRCIHANVSEW